MSSSLIQRAREVAPPLEGDETTERILAAALQQLEEFGLRRSTIEDVARRAGLSRVTIYRRFARKELLVEAVILRELRRFLVQLEQAVDLSKTTEDLLVDGFAFTLEYVRRHTLLNRLLATEPEALVPHLTFDGGPILAIARQFLVERLGQEVREGRLPPLDVEVAGELLVRLVLSFILTPQTALRLDTPAELRRFARRYLAPSLQVTAERHKR